MSRFNSAPQEQVLKRILLDDKNRVRKPSRRLERKNRERETVCQPKLFWGSVEVMKVILSLEEVLDKLFSL